MPVCFMLDKKIIYNSFVSSGARVIGLALSLITIGFISRYLGQDGFGYYATVLAFLYFFTILSDLGLYSICLREISRPGADEAKIFSNAFTLRFFAGMVIFGLSPLIVWFFPYPTEIKFGVLIGAIGFWLMSNQQVLMGVFQKYLKTDKVALAEVSGRLVQLLSVIFIVRKEMGFFYIVAALVAGSLVNFILAYWFSLKYIPISFKFDFDFWKKLLKKSLPLGLAVIFTMIYFKLDTIMLSLMKPPADVGIYNLAYKFLESLLFFPAMFVGLVMPSFSRYAFSDREKFNKISQETLNILLIFAIPLIVGTFFLSERIMVFIAGSGFILSAWVLNILIIAAGIIFLGILFSNMLISLDGQKKLAVIYAAGAFINLTTNFIFIPKYSYYGAAMTTVLTELIVTALMVVVLLRTMGKAPSFKPAVKYLLSALPMTLILYFLAALPLFLLILLAVLVYFGVLFLFGGVSLKDILSFFRFKQYV